ncbi:exodeoxyribonuclease V subunit alpha [Egicoccus halophilus]|uniref:RecBCD enzyme subunit RecD n=1 Tax=Egicoccus halophilus TaxID=1670830 RepID=A0A8J3A8U9_9ACTN|nr:exodeoxyribonuclease V subunit alpha [Egicoccus halophilus]GGI06985.1 RecBCD enzyme subunit RecD [Egicoccus halophilus]
MSATLLPDDHRSDPYEARFVVDCPPTLVPYNLAGVLHPADVHTAVTLCRITGCDDPQVLLAVALAVRGPRVGHVCVDLAEVADTVVADDETAEQVAALPWPADVAVWCDALAAADGLVGAPGADTRHPLTLDGTRLYLDRYWRYEQLVAEQLRRRAARPADDVDVTVLRTGLDELFGEAPGDGEVDLQRLAAATAVLRRLAVVAGGPGTGKTTTVSRVLALLDQQAAAAGNPPPRVALVAPTGKAAARLEESLRQALERDDYDDAVRERLAAAQASTIHRLLRRHPGSSTRFRHHAGEPLPHDVVVVDETSMVSLSLMAKLLDACADHTRVVLVGDPQQLRSVEAGAVLGDIVGPSLHGLRLSEPARERLAAASGVDLPSGPVRRAGNDGDVGTTSDAGTTGDVGGIRDGIVVLQRVHRYGTKSGIAELASAIQSGDADAVVALLRNGPDDVTWVERADDADAESPAALASVTAAVTAVGRRVRQAAEDGHAAAALGGLDELRVLCAHRRGPFGVAAWVPMVEGWLGTTAASTRETWLPGRPVLVTENDHQLKIYNGDVGVVVATEQGPRVAFPTIEGPRLLSPSRLESTETVHAMTIHKSQGSQFTHAVVVLPDANSRILSRELFYTGVTRAERQVTVVGSEAAVRAAVHHVVRRASGLRDHLWRP